MKKKENENAELLGFIFKCGELKEEISCAKISVSVFPWENEHDCYTDSGVELTFECKCGNTHLVSI